MIHWEMAWDDHRIGVALRSPIQGRTMYGYQLELPALRRYHMEITAD
jgi:hypothetical protein